MGLDGLLLHGLVHQLNSLLANTRLHRIQQPSKDDIILSLRGPGVNHRLLLSANPAAARMHLTTAEPANPLSPPPFCMLLRKHLEPARLLALEQPSLERLVILRFETRDTGGERAERLLICEMMGRHSNILLVDPGNTTILDGIRHVTAAQSRHREVLPGRPYIPPPAQEKDDPLHADAASFVFNLRHTPAPQQVAQALVGRYRGMGPDAAREIVARAGHPPGVLRRDLGPEHFEALWEAFHSIISGIREYRIQPWGACDEAGQPAHFWVYPLTHTAPLSERLFPSVSTLLDWYFTQRQQHTALEALRGSIVRPLQTALERVSKRLSLQHQALSAAAKAGDYRLKGELLLSYAHLVSDGAEKAVLPNHYEEDAFIEVELEPALSATGNAQAYFRRYQKARQTTVQAQLQLERSRSELAYLESVLDAAERAHHVADLEEIRDELQAQGILRSREPAVRKERATPGCLRLRAGDGTEVVVGKNNRQNDFITMELARSNDIWLHAKGVPGAHVLIRCHGEPLALGTLTLALHLAALHSSARQSSQVAVDYCERRHVRKPKGARPGFVIYDHHQTAYVTPDTRAVRDLQAPTSKA